MKYNYIKICALGLSALFVSGASSAQTGPGGVSSVGTGTNLKLWLRADQAVFSNAGTIPATNGQPVTQWNDGSGNGASAYNGNSTTRPTYSTSGANGLPTLDFSAGSLQTITAGVDIRPAVMNNVTVIAVARTNSATTNNVWAKIWGHDNPGSGVGFHRGVGIDHRVPASTLSYFAGSGVYGYGSVTANTYFISTATYTTSNFTGFLNGAQTATGVVTCNGGLTAVSIGSLTPTTEFWDGSICEFLIFDKILSEAERVLVENYLGSKYGISIGSVDIYNMDKPVLGNFDYEVAGIGAGTTGAPVTSGQGSGIVRVFAPSAMAGGEYFMFGHDNAPLTMSGPNRPAGFNSRLRRTWRPSETGEVGTMSVSFDLNGVSGIPTNAAEFALVIDRDNDGQFSDETVATTGVITGGSLVSNTITFTGVNINDEQRFTLAFTNTVALPLNLLSFTAMPLGTQNTISWTTANASGIAGMELERSTDGKTFIRMSRIAARESGEYKAIDDVPAAITYYRLRILEQDGSESFSSVQKVLRQDRSGTLRVSPNPASDVAIVAGLPGTSATVRIFDGSGRVVSTRQTAETSLSLSIGAFPPGTYIISVDADGLHAVEQLEVR